MMHVIVRCPQCDSRLPVRAAEDLEQVACGRCGRVVALSWSDEVRGDREVDVCPVCRGAELYLRKDFDPTIGLAVVVIGALISAVFYWFRMDLVAYSILAAAALIDLVVYSRLGDVTVCYRCHSEFRGAYRRTAGAFNLHTADELEPEYERRIGRR